MNLPNNPKTDKDTQAPVSDMSALAQHIRQWGQELGFQQLGFSDTDLGEHEVHLNRWLEKGFHGQMSYMQRHGTRRSRPQELEPGTLRVISARMDYLPETGSDIEALLKEPDKGVVLSLIHISEPTRH